jgi:cysteine desulfurase
MKKRIYLDNAATTSVLPEVFESMRPFFTENYANASAVYTFGQEARQAMDSARAVIAKTLNARPCEIYFTAGGSESDNWALKAVAEKLSDKGKHIITTKIEHHAILHTCEYLEEHGFEVTYLTPDSDGIISADAVEAAIRPDTILISVMTANNEIGTIEPIAKIGAVAKKHGVIFHTDAVQAYAHIPMDVQAMNIDLLSASGHKFHGPKGIGFLYVREDVKIGPLIHGGAQERNRRAGTSNIPGIVGMAKAAEVVTACMEETMSRQQELRNYLIDRLVNEIPHTTVNGSVEHRLPANVNVCFDFVEGETVLILLDQVGICASAGSACTSGSLEPSHVLLSLGVNQELAHGSLRISMGEDTTKEDLDFVVDKLKEIIPRLRKMSPAYQDYLSNIAGK